MAWKITIAGTDRTSAIKAAETPLVIEHLLNEHARATFTCLPSLLPARLDPVVIYAQDGTTPIFGGLILQRSVGGLIRTSSASLTTVECTGFSAYLDWCYVSLTYTAATTLQVVLNALIAALPVGYGITLDATDYTGTPLAAFTWTTMRASDALRDLCARTGLAWRMSPTKVLSLFALPSGSAPESFTDGDPNALAVSWDDPAAVPANTILLACGPTGSAWHTYAWTANGSASSWQMDIPAAGPGVGRTLLLVIGGSNVYATVDEGTGGWFTWDWATATITVNNYPLTLPIPNGTAMSFEYLAQYPFVVQASTSATPEIQYLATDETITEPARGQETADQMLAALGAQPREIQAESITPGWAPGQALTVDLTGRGVDAVFAVTSVRILLETDTLWRYTILATEASAYTGSYLDDWRALTGGGGSSMVAIGGITGGTGGASASALSAHLGGSRSEMQTTNVWTEIVHYQVLLCALTGTYSFRSEVRTTNAATTVTARLFDLTDGAVVPNGTVPASTAITWTETILSVALVAGHRYRVEVRGGNTSAPVLVGQATIEAQA